MMFAITWTLVSSGVFYARTGQFVPTHHTDVTPDYPGGLLGFLWLATNALAWFLAVSV